MQCKPSIYADLCNVWSQNCKKKEEFIRKKQFNSKKKKTEPGKQNRLVEEL